jgi:serine/threonine protein kinase
MRKAIEEAREKQPLAIEPGRLEIHEDQVLGEGSHGRVVAGALSLGPRRTVRVAVKMLPGMTQLEERQAFQRELRAHMLAARHCDGVCHFYGTYELPGSRMALVLKRYERSLRAEIAAARGPLDDTAVCRLARSLARTLAQLADAGIVCRDIKTDNILLDEYGEPVLADFGISVVLSTATRFVPTTIQGTFNYMAPEALNDQAEGGIGPHTDVWALGCVIVEMLTGKMPWEGMPMQQIITAVAMQFRVPTVPEGAPAADVLGRCFAKLPRDRPTAKQLAEAFTLAAVPAPSPVLDQREHEQTLQLAQRMVEQEAITEEVTRVNSRLTQEISQLKQENVRELTALKQQISAGEEELASKVRELDTERERAMAAETSMEVLEGKLQALTREASAVSEELARKEKELSRMRDAQSELESREAMLREEKNALQEELGNKFSKGHYIATFCSINITGR